MNIHHRSLDRRSVPQEEPQVPNQIEIRQSEANPPGDEQIPEVGRRSPGRGVDQTDVEGVDEGDHGREDRPELDDARGLLPRAVGALGEIIENAVGAREEHAEYPGREAHLGVLTVGGAR